MAWRKLSARYESKTKSTKIQMKREYHNCKLDKNGNPDNWVTKMENYRIQLKTIHNFDITDEDFYIN